MAGQRAWAPVGSPVTTLPPSRDCIRSAVANLSQDRGGDEPSKNCPDTLFLPLCLHSGPPLPARARRFCRSISTPVPRKFSDQGRLYMISSRNCSGALLLSLCLHSGLRRRPARGAPVALSPLRCPGSSPAGIDYIGFPVVNLPGAVDWARGLPGGAPKNPRSKQIKSDIATDPLLNGPQNLFLAPWRSRMQGQEKSFDKDKEKSV